MLCFLGFKENLGPVWFVLDGLLNVYYIFEGNGVEISGEQ
jgi:hypothetical protein